VTTKKIAASVFWVRMEKQLIKFYCEVDMDGGLSKPRFKCGEDVINLY
jgi:hypothetical protein